MAADPFNSKGGYTIGIPPIPILDSNGNLTVPEAVIGNVIIEGDQVVSGTITSNLFIGSFQGNIVGNFVVPGLDTYVLFNEDGFAGASETLTYNYTNNILTVQGDLITDTITVGTGANEFSTTSVMFATTVRPTRSCTSAAKRACSRSTATSRAASGPFRSASALTVRPSTFTACLQL